MDVNFVVILTLALLPIVTTVSGVANLIKLDRIARSYEAGAVDSRNF